MKNSGEPCTVRSPWEKDLLPGLTCQLSSPRVYTASTMPMLSSCGALQSTAPRPGGFHCCLSWIAFPGTLGVALHHGNITATQETQAGLLTGPALGKTGLLGHPLSPKYRAFLTSTLPYTHIFFIVSVKVPFLQSLTFFFLFCCFLNWRVFRIVQAVQETHCVVQPVLNLE